MNTKELNKSIAELEGYKWQGDIPTSESSFLERRFYELHYCKLKDLTVNDIDLYIEQGYGLKYVVPLALELLEKDLLIETDYEGALLFNILSSNPDYWTRHYDFKNRIIKLFIENQQKF